MRAIIFFGVLLLVALPLFAVQITSVDDVIRMHRAGVSDDAIVDALARVRDPLDVTQADVVAMKRAGLSDRVVEAVVAAARADAGPSGRNAEPVASADDEEWPDNYCRTFDPPVEIYPYYWPVPDWLWDPYWYMPRLDSTVGERAPVKPAKPAGESVMREQRREAPKRDAYRPSKQEVPRAIRPPSRAPRR